MCVLCSNAIALHRLQKVCDGTSKHTVVMSVSSPRGASAQPNSQWLGHLRASDGPSAERCLTLSELSRQSWLPFARTRAERLDFPMAPHTSDAQTGASLLDGRLSSRCPEHENPVCRASSPHDDGAASSPIPILNTITDFGRHISAHFTGLCGKAEPFGGECRRTCPTQTSSELGPFHRLVQEAQASQR